MKLTPNKGQLTFEERVQIMSGLNSNKSLLEIANLLNRCVSTIRREVKKHTTISTDVSVGQRKNRCLFHKTCKRTNVCQKVTCKNRLCHLCKDCNTVCPDFLLRTCKNLENPALHPLASATLVAKSCVDAAFLSLMESIAVLIWVCEVGFSDRLAFGNHR